MENNKNLTLENFINALKNLHKEDYPEDFNFLEYPKHHVWEKDGVKHSSWEISKGVFTGDGGMEMFEELVKKECEKLYIIGTDPYTSDGEGSIGAVWDDDKQEYIILPKN